MSPEFKFPEFKIFPDSFGINLSFAVTPNILWLVFAIIVVFYAIMSWVLVYHWDKHGTGKILFVKAVYSLVTISMLIVMAASIILYSSSL